MEPPENQVRLLNNEGREDKGILSAHYRGEIRALGRNLMEHPGNVGAISS